MLPYTQKFTSTVQSNFLLFWCQSWCSSQSNTQFSFLTYVWIQQLFLTISNQLWLVFFKIIPTMLYVLGLCTSKTHSCLLFQLKNLIRAPVLFLILLHLRTSNYCWRILCNVKSKFIKFVPLYSKLFEILPKNRFLRTVHLPDIFLSWLKLLTAVQIIFPTRTQKNIGTYLHTTDRTIDQIVSSQV